MNAMNAKNYATNAMKAADASNASAVMQGQKQCLLLRCFVAFVELRPLRWTGTRRNKAEHSQTAMAAINCVTRSVS